MRTQKFIYIPMFMCVLITLTILIPIKYTPAETSIFVNLFYLALGVLIIASVRAGRTPKPKDINMKKSTANFHYTMENYGNMKYIAIVDFGGPYRSVTNDIENVVDDILKWEGIKNYRDYFVIWKDSMGTWDGYNISTREIVLLSDESSLEAAKHYYMVQHNEAANENEIWERQYAE